MNINITKTMIEAAEEAYAEHRAPQRWDGPPWGEAGQMNHRKAIRAALEAGFKIAAQPKLVIQAANSPMGGLYLKGPRSPAEVRRRGYGFTKDIAEAWPFDTPGKASRKRHAVARHMSWSLDKLEVKSV